MLEASMAKLAASEAAHKAADRAMQILASAGYRRGSVVERLFRDVRATEIYQGTSEAQRMIIAERRAGRASRLYGPMRPEPDLCRVSLKNLFRDRLQLQVRRAFVDLADLRVAIQLLDRVVLHEAVAAEQVDRERRDALGDFRREELAHRRLGEKRLAARRAAAPLCRPAAAPLRRRWRRARAGAAPPGTRRSPCRTACRSLV